MASILNSPNYLRVETPLEVSKEGKKVSGIEILVHRCEVHSRRREGMRLGVWRCSLAGLGRVKNVGWGAEVYSLVSLQGGTCSILSNTKASGVWVWLTSKIWSQSDIICWQHPVQNLLNYSFICTIFAETEKSWVNAGWLVAHLPVAGLPEPSLLLYICQHAQSHVSLFSPSLLLLSSHSESARSSAMMQTLSPFPPLHRFNAEGGAQGLDPCYQEMVGREKSAPQERRESGQMRPSENCTFFVLWESIFLGALGVPHCPRKSADTGKCSVFPLIWGLFFFSERHISST